MELCNSPSCIKEFSYEKDTINNFGGGYALHLVVTGICCGK